MGRVPSIATQLANARRVNRDLERRLNTTQIELTHYRARATKAEQAAADWQKRFDALLLKLPEKP